MLHHRAIVGDPARLSLIRRVLYYPLCGALIVVLYLIALVDRDGEVLP